MARPRGARRRAELTRERLAEEYPDAECALVHDDPFQLLVATILSAQTTDDTVNKVTPALFARYPTPDDLAHADPADVETIIHPTGFFRSKAKNVIGMARALVDDHDGVVPTELDELVRLPGVGRKTGNVVRSVAFDLPGLPVDTHVGRVSRRLKLTTEDDPVRAELDLNELVPPAERGRFSLRLILHGRQVCFARRPACDRCVLDDFCPSAFRADGPPVRAGATTVAPPATRAASRRGRSNGGR
jgi:endonuclease-3